MKKEYVIGARGNTVYIFYESYQRYQIRLSLSTDNCFIGQA